MEQRLLGRTGLEISRVVFGGGYVGGLLIFADDATRRRAITRALVGGICWIDTAPMYGEGRSEQALGWLLGEIQRPPRLSTKVYLDTTRLDDIAGQVEASVAASLHRLGRDRVDLLFLHNAIGPRRDGDTLAVDDVLRPGGVADALDAVRRSGRTGFVGLTAAGDNDAVQAAVGSGRFDVAQVYFNMINPSAGRDSGRGVPGQDFSGLLAACKAQDMGTMAIRVFASGVLATDQRHGREGPMTTDAALADEEVRARDVLGRLGMGAAGMTPWGSRAQAALRYVLAEDRIDAAVVGLAELDHLEQVLAAAAAGPLPAEVIRRLDARFCDGAVIAGA